jgi:hypothetical protein
MDRDECPLDPSHVAPKIISKPMVRSAQTMYLSCVQINTISKQIEMSFHFTRHLGVPSGAPKMISMPIVHLAQTVHPSCIKMNSISKWTEMSFHLTDVT